MQKKFLNLIAATLLSLLAISSFAQEGEGSDASGSFKRSLYEADLLFNDGSYLRALEVYDSLWDIRPNQIYLQYMTGVCHIYKSDGREKAFDILKELKGEPGFDEVTFYMARAKHLNYNFQEAIDLYNEFLEVDKPSGSRRINTLQFIENCKNGIEIMSRRIGLSLEMLVPPSNDRNSQYSPVLSPDGMKLYYTNRGEDSKGDMMDEKSKKTTLGKHYEDTFVAENIGSDDEIVFSEGTSLSDNINLPGIHEAPLSLSYNNQMLFVYVSGAKANEDIYVSYNQNDTGWTVPIIVKGINTPHWEGHAMLGPDNKTLFFSSDRPGGYGKRDLYMSTMKPDSTYERAVNLGPKINTPFNEDAPFIYTDGKSLYFASEAHGSMGGYDIFYTTYDSASQTWDDQQNLGYPINTTDDDRFYYISVDGEWGYFSSARGSGENLHDIYRIKPGTFERLNSLVLLIGTIYIDDVPSSAIAKIMAEPTGDVLATLVSDSITGEFIYSLLPGREYKISLLADGFPPKIEYVEVPPINQGVMRIEHRFDFYTKGYLAANDTNGNLQDELNKLEVDSSDQMGVCPVEPEREELTPEEIASGCAFRVQVGAYRNPGKFRYEFLRELGEVEIKGYPDGITRYLMGQKFTKRSEAEVLRQKCVLAGQWDAWITVRRE